MSVADNLLYLSENIRHMRRLLSTIAVSLFCICSFSQSVGVKDIEKNADKSYGKNIESAALALANEFPLNDDGEFEITRIIEAQGKSKDEIYVALNYWFTSNFKNANGAIKLNDKELGTIIANAYVNDAVVHTGGMNKYWVNIEYVIKCDIKDGRARVRFTAPGYSVEVRDALGIYSRENWPISKCYPYDQGDKKKKTSSKALVMVCSLSMLLEDDIEKTLEKVTSDDDW